MQAVNGVYEADIAKAKQPDAKSALAKTLLRAATESKDDPAIKYVLLETARDLAVGGNDLELPFAAIAELGAYQIDRLKVSADALNAMSKAQRRTWDALMLASRANPLIDDAIAADRYLLAAQLADLAASWAKMARNPEALGSANARVEEVRETEAASARAQKAAAILAKKPSDPAANLIMGRFQCFQKGQWKTGLPMLAAASDAEIKALAASELAKPLESDKQITLADGWWSLSSKEKGSVQRRIRQHAAQWYESALPHVTGLVKTKLEKRLDESRAAAGANAEWIDLLKTIKLDRDAVSGKWTFDGPDLQVASGARSARLGIMAEPGRNYEVHVEYERPAGGDAFAVYLPVGDGRCIVATSPRQIGLDTVNGKYFQQNETTKAGEFGGGAKHSLDITVTCSAKDARITVRFDDKEQVAWIGPTSKLAVSPDWAFPSPKALGLASWDTAITISAMRLKEK
jgi:hypothetical protein